MDSNILNISTNEWKEVVIIIIRREIPPQDSP